VPSLVNSDVVELVVDNAVDLKYRVSAPTIATDCTPYLPGLFCAQPKQNEFY
jgi:hypothetical protein